MFYGTAVWDPWLIVGQIICLQCSFYLSLGVFMILFLGLRVPRLSLVYFFDYATLTTSTLTGWCVIASFLCASLAGAVYMIFLVERARKCLDFSATLYIIHLFFCILYGGWPSSMAWWVVNGTGLAVMALLAEYLCIKREQREIPMDRFHSRNPDYIRCVSVHPTLPYVLSSSDDMLIKFWDWEKGLDIHSDFRLCYANYFTGTDQPYLSSGSDDLAAKVPSESSTAHKCRLWHATTCM
ncbi:unnamed protein product [Brassica rapa subsp. narinosa]